MWYNINKNILLILVLQKTWDNPTAVIHWLGNWYHIKLLNTELYDMTILYDYNVFNTVSLKLGTAIPGSRIPAFLEIPNPGIGGVSIPGFRDHKNELKLYFFMC